MLLQESGDAFKRFINMLGRWGFTQRIRPRASKAKIGLAKQMHPTRLPNSAKHNRTEAEYQSNADTSRISLHRERKWRAVVC
jgi:hypothetical protein